MSRIAHQASDEGVLIVLRPSIGSPASIRITTEEAKRFARAVLEDVDEDWAGASSDLPITIGAITLERSERRLLVGGVPVRMTAKEFDLVEALALRRGGTVTKQAIMDHLYGGLDEPDAKVVDVFACKIRNRLRPFGVDAQIETVWGRGYRMVATPSADSPTVAGAKARPPSPLQDAILERLKQGSASLLQIWGATPETGENTLRNALATLIARREVERVGEPRHLIYRLPSAAAA